MLFCFRLVFVNPNFVSSNDILYLLCGILSFYIFEWSLEIILFCQFSKRHIFLVIAHANFMYSFQAQQQQTGLVKQKILNCNSAKLKNVLFESASHQNLDCAIPCTVSCQIASKIVKNIVRNASWKCFISLQNYLCPSAMETERLARVPTVNSHHRKDPIAENFLAEFL